MLSTQLSKLIRLSVITVGLSGIALAQYGGTGATGGTGSNGGTYSSSGKSYGHGAIIGGIVGAAAGGTVLFLVLRHHHQKQEVVGCVGSDGKTMNADNSKTTYQLSGMPITAGEHVSVLAKKTKGDSGVDGLQVFSVTQDLGQCSQQTASLEARPSRAD